MTDKKTPSLKAVSSNTVSRTDSPNNLSAELSRQTQELSPSPLPLTAKEKSVLEFIEKFQVKAGICPSYQEIKEHFGFASFNSVQNYLKQLIAKGYLHVPLNQKRAIQILHSASALQNHAIKYNSAGPSQPPLLQSNEEVLSLPLLGKVAAGQPLESFKHNEFVKIPADMVKYGSKTFALKVEGDSMINEGIFSGDTVLVQQQSHADNGDIIVASVDNESTIKKFYLRTSKGDAKVELRPANDQLESMWYSPDEVQIQGILVGLLRKF